MAIPHEDIFITIVPDEYHIRFAGITSAGEQVFVTSDLKYDAQSKKTTDYIVVYTWDPKGIFIKADVTKLGVRGEYNNEKASKIHNQIESSFESFKLGSIRVKPCSFTYDGIEFGFIPRTEDDYTMVEVMPGNSLCFLEPFDGEYDT